MFTAFGVLVAAIAIFATKPPEAVHYWWDPTIFFLCWTTTALSLFAWVRFQSKDKWAWTARLLVAVLILSGIILQVVYARQQANDMRNAIDQLRQQVHSMSPGRHGPATE
jgi:glucan phosphoethanolaminetransferase (alkaline phosphatase superfamily)